MAEMSPLRQRMIGDMTVRNLSPTTQRSRVHAVAKFSRFLDRSPAGSVWKTAGFSGASRIDWDLVAGVEPDALSAALLL